MPDNQEEKISQRFKLIRKMLELGQVEFAKQTGIMQSMVSAIENGKRIITPAIYLSLEDSLNINRKWLITGEGEMFLPESNAKLITQTNDPLEVYENKNNSKFLDLGNGKLLMTMRKVPEQARMGYAHGWADPEFIETLDYHSIIVDKIHRGHYMAFEAVGDSMENYTSEEMSKESIPHGATVTGREVGKHLWDSKFHNHKWPDFIVVLEDGIVIKRLIHHDVENGLITLHSLNPNKRVYPDKEYSLDEVKQIFNVINVTIER
ncbi:Helix-turn-helix domain protein [compost metagenome]